jgi:multiple sugar transport system substrate-binding protein
MLMVLTLSLSSCKIAPKAPETETETTAETTAETETETTAETTAPVTIDFWNGVGEPDASVLSKIIDDFNKTNKDGITVKETMMDWATLYSKIILDFKVGNAPDACTMQQTFLTENVSLGLIADIGKLAQENGFKKEDFVDIAWNGSFIEGKQFAIPLDQHPMALYYNVKLFKDAGLDPTKPPVTKEEFLEYAQKLTKGSSQYGFGLGYSGGAPFRTWMSLLWQHKDSDVLTPDLTKASFNTPAGIESLQVLQDLVYKYKVVPVQEQDPVADFTKGLVAMIIDGPWNMMDFNKETDLEYMTAPIPVFFDQPAVWGNSHELVIINKENNEAKQQAAVKLFKFISDNSITWTKEAGHMPVIKSILESAEFKGLEKHQAFMKSLGFMHYYPLTVKQSQVFGREPTSPFVIMIESVMLNKATSQKAIEDAEKAVNGILAQQ